jgi:hypothetical protein
MMTEHPSFETLYFDTAEGIRLHAQACGPAGAPVLLFVHGFPECWYTWHWQLAAFEAEFRCVAICARPAHPPHRRRGPLAAPPPCRRSEPSHPFVSVRHTLIRVAPRPV